MINKINSQELIDSLCELISSENEKNGEFYTTILPSKIQALEGKRTPEFGHPVNWMISGFAGNHAFVIGDLSSDNIVKDDLTEQNYYPPILTQALASLGSEYVYSQLAIVLLSDDVDVTTLNWVYEWKDDPRYFRKIIVPITGGDKIKNIANQIVGNILFPWSSIKSSLLSDTTITGLFNDDNEEEDNE
ncbi:hypothetical protein CR203_24030 [Salipaludibacillus neizhouensis]|uniref:Uncharacterized protein n=1 Tax=Salipaludibacillus neizhouensis TaxID=885475 RepID=A0A3A9K1T6_9BACI|nr:hypothetical protein [Salipaludibacillus neizhouensis]RKL64860.1 hypothetical protein CR203_24030 [Salipaludibacillus neizhouensis]